jgi:hypothetical protein
MWWAVVAHKESIDIMGKTPSRRIKPVSSAQWADAIKILMGQDVKTKALAFTDQKTLRAHLRGPFKNGMTQEQAVKVIDTLGWRVYEGK